MDAFQLLSMLTHVRGEHGQKPPPPTVPPCHSTLRMYFCKADLPRWGSEDGLRLFRLTKLMSNLRGPAQLVLLASGWGLGICF